MHLCSFLLGEPILMFVKFSGLLEVYYEKESPQVFSLPDVPCCHWSRGFLIPEVSTVIRAAGKGELGMFFPNHPFARCTMLPLIYYMPCSS